MKKYEEQYWRSYEQHQRRERDKLTREDREELIRFGVIMACILILVLSIISTKADRIAQAVLHYERPALTVVTAADVEPLPVDEPAEIIYYYDVPLAADLQDYIYTCCEHYGLWPELVLAVIEVESSYNATAYNGSCYGLMQIHEVNHPRLMDELGVTDFYDPKDNIQAGCYMLSELLCKYGEAHAALMCYNCGERRAAELWAEGVYTTAYSRKVVEIIKRLEDSEL